MCNYHSNSYLVKHMILDSIKMISFHMNFISISITCTPRGIQDNYMKVQTKISMTNFLLSILSHTISHLASPKKDPGGQQKIGH